MVNNGRIFKGWLPSRSTSEIFQQKVNLDWTKESLTWFSTFSTGYNDEEMINLLQRLHNCLEKEQCVQYGGENNIAKNLILKSVFGLINSSNEILLLHVLQIILLVGNKVWGCKKTKNKAVVTLLSLLSTRLRKHRNPKHLSLPWYSII